MGSGFGMEEENKERDRLNPKRGGIDGDPTQEKRKGEKTPTRWSTPKAPQRHTIPSTTNLPPPPKQKKKEKTLKQNNNLPPTSNIHSGISVASSLIFSLILSLRRLSTALWLSLLLRRFSFASRACLSPTGCGPCCCGAC